MESPRSTRKGLHEIAIRTVLKRSKCQVCQLKRQWSPRTWLSRFSQLTLKTRYKKCHVDHTLFIKRNVLRVTILIVYVNNTVVRRNDVVEVERLKKHLHSKFDIKNLRELRWFLGIEIDAKKMYTTEGNS